MGERKNDDSDSETPTESVRLSLGGAAPHAIVHLGARSTVYLDRDSMIKVNGDEPVRIEVGPYRILMSPNGGVEVQLVGGVPGNLTASEPVDAAAEVEGAQAVSQRVTAKLLWDSDSKAELN